MSLRDAPLEDSMKRDTRSEVITRLHGYRLVIVRLTCLFLYVLSVGLVVASMPSYFASLHMLCTGTATACNANVQLAPGDVRRLQELGLSIDFFATYIIVITSIFALGYWLVAALLFWRKSDNPLALLAALTLGTFPIAFNDDFIRTLSSSWWLLAHVISFLGSVCIVLFFYVFPSGHFVPRWTRFVLVPTLVYWWFSAFFPLALFNPFFRLPVLDRVTFAVLPVLPVPTRPRLTPELVPAPPWSVTPPPPVMLMVRLVLSLNVPIAGRSSGASPAACSPMPRRSASPTAPTSSASGPCRPSGPGRPPTRGPTSCSPP